MQSEARPPVLQVAWIEGISVKINREVFPEGSVVWNLLSGRFVSALWSCTGSSTGAAHSLESKQSPTHQKL